METETGSRSGHTGVDTVYTKGSAGAFATLHTPSVITTSHARHARIGIGDGVDDAVSCCRSTALYCLGNVAGGKEEVENDKWGKPTMSGAMIRYMHIVTYGRETM